MKMILTVFTLFSSVAALAHPQDSDYIDNLGDGTTLTVIRAVNIPAQRHSGRIGEWTYDDGQRSYRAHCEITPGSVSDRDRAVSAGRTLVFDGKVGILPDGSRWREGFAVANYQIFFHGERDFYMYCQKVTRSHDGRSYPLGSGLTVGEFRAIMRGNMAVQLAEPDEL